MQYNQFLVLRYIIESKNVSSQREIAESSTVGLSLGNVNSVLKSLIELGYIKKEKNYLMTTKGISKMEIYKVDNCIIFAAGFGSRMRPITLTTPKPLVKVNGTAMIESVINSVYKAGIRTFNIVVGYKNEMFEYLIEKYSDCEIKLIKNLEYDFYNNISSLNSAKDYLGNSYFCEADLVVNKNINIFHQYEYKNFYCGVYTKGRIDDWVFVQKNKNKLLDIKLGGEDENKMVGISFFNRESCELLREAVTKALNDNALAKEWYWDYIPLRETNIDISLRNINENDVIEIDNISELVEVDSSYKDMLE